MTTYNKVFHYHNDRLADLLTYKAQRDKSEFDRLFTRMDKYVKAHPDLGAFLQANKKYDHKSVSY
jgi:hypothetical protein